jgi:protoheme IX farnesyltransferase
MNAAELKRSLSLFRPAIALFAGCSALTAYLAAPGRDPLIALLVTTGVLALAAGSSSLNQCQERDIDSRMARTRTRPLPAGIATARQALFLSLLLLCFGSSLLFAAGTLPALLGVFAVAWYNGIYTLLKRRTAFAAVPGAVVGMVPPAIGWVGAGGSISDPRLIALCFLFFMWQVPHFWLQILHHGKEYEKAGLPSLSSLVSGKRLGNMIFVWVCSASVSGLLLPLYGTLSAPVLYFLLLPPAFAVIVKTFPLLTASTPERTLSAFRTINVYILLVMALLPLEGLLR